MVTIGMTGGIACGKSLAASMMAQEGFSVCEADTLAHGCLRSGQVCYREVIGAFGGGILDGEGEIDRQRLGERVFRDSEAMAVLNEIVHPRVRVAWREWAASESRGQNVVVVIPLLFEVGESEGWDAIVCVGAPRAAQMARLQGRGLDEESALRRIAAQWPWIRKAEQSDVVVYNSGSRAGLATQIRGAIRRIMEMK